MGRHLPVLMLIVPAIICISALPITSGIGVRENLYVWLLFSHGDRHREQQALTLDPRICGESVVEPGRRRAVIVFPQSKASTADALGQALGSQRLQQLFNSPSRRRGALGQARYLPPSVIRLPLRVNMILSSRVSMEVTFGAANS